MATPPPLLCSFPAEVGDPLGAFEAFVRGEGGESEEAVEEEEETGQPGQGPYYHRKGKGKQVRPKIAEHVGACFDKASEGEGGRRARETDGR